MVGHEGPPQKRKRCVNKGELRGEFGGGGMGGRIEQALNGGDGRRDAKGRGKGGL